MKYPIIILGLCVTAYFIYIFNPTLPKTQSEVKIKEADEIFIGALSEGMSSGIINKDSSLNYSLKYANVKRDCTIEFSLEFAKNFAFMIGEIKKSK